MGDWGPMAWTGTQPIEAFAAFAWGALWGSFANVVIHRLPLGLSLVRPASRCPQCETPIRPIHNVPILGWLWLRGRCASCRTPISVRYPLVELAAALLAVGVWARLVMPLGAVEHHPGAAAAAVLVFFFVLSLLIISFIDLDYRIIPHPLTLPFIVAGPLAATFLHPYTGVSWGDSGLGILIGGGVVFLVMEAYFRLRGAEGMGGGDVTLMAMLGAWLGYEAVLFLFFASSLQGTLVATVLHLTGRSFPEPLPWPGDDESAEAASLAPAAADAEDSVGFAKMQLPFGPFLVLAGLEWFYFQPQLSKLFAQLYGLE